MTAAVPGHAGWCSIGDHPVSVPCQSADDPTLRTAAELEPIPDEAHLQRLVDALCDVLGVGHYHPHDSRRTDFAGWPDLVMWAAGGMLFRELKSENGRPSRAQLQVGRELEEAGADWDIWRPDDWHSGRIEREIRGILAP